MEINPIVATEDSKFGVISSTPEFSFFQSVNVGRMKGEIDTEPGLILGFEWNIDCDTKEPFNLSKGYWQYTVYFESEAPGVEEQSRWLLPNDAEFLSASSQPVNYPHIPKPDRAPAFKIGQSFYEKRNECHVIITECKWGRLNWSDKFLPGWNYIVYYVLDPFVPEHDWDNDWDVDGGYTEWQLIKQFEYRDRDEDPPSDEMIESIMGDSISVQDLTELTEEYPDAIAQIANYLGIERSEVKKRAERKELILMPKHTAK